MNPEDKRRVLRMLSNGIYVITSRNGDRYGASTVTWVSQASFQPPLIMVAVRKNSNVFKCLSASRVAVLNILEHAQEDVARKFLMRTKGRDGALNGERVTAGITSAPVLQCAPAYAECTVSNVLHHAGDHAVVILEVVEAQCRRSARPLTVAESPWTYGG